jgi:hypothetical protein
VLIVAVLLVTVLFRAGLVVTVVYLLLPRGPLCPHCHVETARVRNAFLARLLPVLERRWCIECGWGGVVRRGPPGSDRPSRTAVEPAPPTWE